MRSYVITVVIVTLLAGGSFWSNHYISSSTEELVKAIDQVEEQIYNQDWDKAKSQLQQLKQDWDVTKNVWSVLVTHQEIDTIDIGLKRLGEYVQFKSPILAEGELSALRLLFDHISDTEAFNLKNVF
ncbi:DUF4363 family protein [Desulfitobacterium sp.]|uniref:DUF4363 family protein n=1 Tax=Desulfitobacterium sp. TaxID=49981 RepID=UPI002C4241EB|nr:DUF4363 family protein [Desulfitobacterium sp.]HVJ47847.1 DUF4363 family protein [Desulfitobacterium sp.]